MIAQVLPEIYDALGKKVIRPFDRRRGPHPTFPMGRYVSQPLVLKCADISEMRRFLLTCKAVSDEKQFKKGDYWQPPEEFEETKQGDCDCFALWTWRQMLQMGYDARVVFGRSGRYGAGHAWVQYFIDDSCFLVEPQAAPIGELLLRLSTLQYHPNISVAWDGNKLSYYQHSKNRPNVGMGRSLLLLPEWIAVWTGFWLRHCAKIPRVLWHLGSKFLRGFRAPFSRKG